MFLLAFSINPIAAQTQVTTEFLQVHGTVVDKASGQLLQASVEVLIHGTEDQVAITDTNTEGHYGLILDSSSIFDLRVELDGYITFIETIDLRDDHPKEKELKIVLTKKEEVRGNE